VCKCLVVEYEMIPNADFHGRYDYKCPRTRASWGCVLSVYGLNNAKKQCTYDEQCKAFTVIAHYARPGMCFMYHIHDNFTGVI